MEHFWILSTLAVVNALPSPENLNQNIPPTMETAARSMGKDCSNGIFSGTCLKIEAISMLEKLNAKDELHLLPGVSVVRETKHTLQNDSKAEEFAAELARTLPSKPDERLDKYLIYQLGNYLDSHSLKFKLLNYEASEDAKEIAAESRAKKVFGKKGGLGGLMAAAVMMKGTLMSMGMGALALLAGKALMTAMMSLLLSAVVGLKSISGGGKSTTYEIVSKPIYTHSHSHSSAHEDVGGFGHSGYARNFKETR